MCTVSIIAPPQVEAQYGNGPLVWVDYKVLNRTNRMPLSYLNGFLSAETLNHVRNQTAVPTEEGTVTVSAGGIFHIGQPVQMQASIWSGKNNKTINTLDFLLLQVSSNNSTSMVQKIHIYNVPGAVSFLLTNTYTFSAQGEYIVTVRFNGITTSTQESTTIQVTRQ
jgi:hypothetical protein